MAIDWTQAPEGTTHGMVNGGEIAWYRNGTVMERWSEKYGWLASFFRSVEDATELGLCMHKLGEQSELVMLREQRDALLAILVELVDMEGPQPGNSEWGDKALVAIAKCEANITKCRE